MGRTFWFVWGPTYAAVMAFVIGALWQARREAMTVFETPEAIQDWQKWKAEAQRQEKGQGPVWRRAPRVDEPPAAILMRDYFAVSLVGSLVLTSALYWSLAFMIHGALCTKALPVEPAEPPSPPSPPAAD